MCGIAGVVGPWWEPSTLTRMVEALAHRGPDARAHRAIPTSGRQATVGLGHARLSILDLSDAGLQPMSDPTRELTVVHNGEIYNYLELRQELGGNQRFRTGTDTEVLLAAYEAWGDACVERFNGMFAFALWDARAQRLFCARDRLGIKPFHFTWHDGHFWFGSELRSLFAAGIPAEPDLSTWAEYLVHGVYDHDSRTFFRNIHALAPGETLVLEGEQVVQPRAGWRGGRAYWRLPEAVDALEQNPEQAEAEFAALLEDAVRLRLRSDVAVGVNLSGGLDSATLMGTVDGLISERAQVETFTASFSDPAYDEADFAAAVPHRATWVRHVSRVGERECRALLQEVAQHQSAPFGGVATVAYHALHQKAREAGVTVLLEGQGVDELLGGYAYYRPLRYLDLVEAGQEAEASREAEAFGDDLRGTVDLARREVKGNDAPRYQDGSRHLRPECVHPDLVALAGPRPRFERPFKSHLTNALYRDLRHTKLPRVLRMNDRLSMAHGRELREPFLDHRLVELAFSLPGSQKVGGGVSKRLLRRLMAPRLTPAVSGTPKRAVVTPQREWLRGPWQAIVREALGSSALRERGWLRPSRASSAFERFVDGQGDNAFFVWQWIMVAMEERFR